MAEHDGPSEAALEELRRHRFPGGHYRVARWENWLLTECTGREPMPDGLVHPIALFHVPILGAGTSIGELFRLGGAAVRGGAVGLLGYDWRYHRPLCEDVDYEVTGGIAAADRHVADNGAVHDDVTFEIELRDDDGPVARVTNRWRFRRTTVRAPDPAPPREAPDGAPIPAWEMASVEAGRMRTMAALLRDPYPRHWDRAANERDGLGARVVNQGPLNLAYVANMLMAWAGPASIRRLTAAFGRYVLDGDRVVAGGVVEEVNDGVADCAVWLARGDERVVTGRAEVAVPAEYYR